MPVVGDISSPVELFAVMDISKLFPWTVVEAKLTQPFELRKACIAATEFAEARAVVMALTLVNPLEKNNPKSTVVPSGKAEVVSERKLPS